MQQYDIIIVGAGPSGCATAIELANLDSSLAPRVLLLDKAVFPRIKLCAGGLTTDAEMVLEKLGVHVNLPAIPVHRSLFLLPTGRLTFEKERHFRVIRRDQFDEHLYKTAELKGVVAQHGEEVNEIIRTSQEVIIKTSKQEYRTKVLVGADGANSSVRQAAGLHRTHRLMVAMEIITPLSITDLPDLADNMAIFDIRLTTRGVPGYCWIFPSLYERSRAVSLGIMAAPSRKSETVPVKALFTEWVTDQGIDVGRMEPQAHPILRYEPHARSSTHRVVLTGDAAGIDPLFGEGIFSALALGRVTAGSILEALKRNDFEFSDYESRIRSSTIGSIMRRRRLLAKRLYAQPRLSQYLLQYGPLLKWIARLQLQQGEVSWEAY